MPNDPQRDQIEPGAQPSSRRAFLKSSSALAVGGTVAATLGSSRMVHAASDETLKIALIGCGGRGTKAVVNAMNADQNIQLTVLADAFEDRIDSCKGQLQRRLGNRYAVPNDQCFAGFDAYKSVMATDVDVVLLATPPHFRPAHLAACIESGKHVFCEKPVAVDGPGVASVLGTVAQAREKNLTIVSGLCWRYDYGVRATMERIFDGAIGDIVAIQENYLTGTLWHRGRKPEWSEMEYQMRNWLYFTWLSGDHIVEQHVHSLDKALWLMQDVPPAKCVGLGGRQMRTDPQWGNAFDHFAVCYEWDNGVKAFAYTRQMSGCKNDVEDYVLGTKGQAKLLQHRIEADGSEWQYPRKGKPSMYDVEHVELFAGLRNGNHINNGEYMSYSTLMAIMGREACYTGEEITSDQVLSSQRSLGPTEYQWGDVQSPTVARPGVTKFT